MSSYPSLVHTIWQPITPTRWVARRYVQGRPKFPRQRRQPYSSPSTEPHASGTPRSSNSTKTLPSSQPHSPAASSPTPSNSSGPSSNTSSRFARVHARLPRFLQRYTKGLLSAPVSHIATFLILHEVTAIVPLFGFGYWFYKSETLPWFAEGRYFDEGIKRTGKYFRRKGWLGAEDQEKLDKLEKERTGEGLDAYLSDEGVDEGVKKASGAHKGEGISRWMVWRGWMKGGKESKTRRAKWWEKGENGVHLVTSFAAAYALTKVLLPIRLVLSVWATPFTARVATVPFTRWAMSFPKRIIGIFKRRRN